MHAIHRHAIAEVIGDDKSVAEFDEHAFEREAIGGCFGIGTHGIMANENHTFRFTPLGKHDFAGQGDQIDIAIDTGVGADDLDDFVLVAVFEQFLNDSSSGHAAGLRFLESIGGTVFYGFVILRDGGSIRQITAVRQTFAKVGLRNADDFKLQIFSGI